MFIVFLLAVFFTASRTKSPDAPRHALPLLVACVMVTTALASLRFVS